MAACHFGIVGFWFRSVTLESKSKVFTYFSTWFWTDFKGRFELTALGGRQDCPWTFRSTTTIPWTTILVPDDVIASCIPKASHDI
jgi:hypothetical protein